MTEAEILASTYEHTADIQRPVMVADGNLDYFELQTVHANIPCAVSFRQGSTQGETETTQPIRYIATLFVMPNVEVLAGDKVVATIMGRQREFKAGEGVYYPSHAAIPLIREDDA